MDGWQSHWYFSTLESGSCNLGIIPVCGLYILYIYLPGLTRATQELCKMLPYVVTIIVLVITSKRNKQENQPPASLGEAYFREDR